MEGGRACHTGVGAEFGSGSDKSGTGPTPAPIRLGPVLYGSGSDLLGASFDFFMHVIILNAEIEMNTVINSVPGPKSGSGSD